MAIIALGLLLFALLIGNMQNFLQALGRRYDFSLNRYIQIIIIVGLMIVDIHFSFRRLEMSLRRRDVEEWMRHRALPPNLQRLQ